MQRGMRDKHIVLGICGGIAAYKSVELLRLLQKGGAAVRVIMTRHATEFVGPLTFAAISGNKVSTSLFEKGDAGAIRHIDWAREADLVVVAPATANLIGKLAHGIADDALSTFMMAVTAPTVICPSMNTHMYLSRAVQRNLDILRADGRLVVAPGEGELACGTTGPGRLPDPADIVDRVQACLTPKDLAGKTVLVTAGPTQEPIDPVRFISNPSSGKMGFALARAAEHRGADVVLVSGPTHLQDPFGVHVIRIRTAAEMAAAVYEHMESAHIIVKSAAVSDYRPVAAAGQKIKKSDADMVLSLTRTEDILKTLGGRKKAQVLVGFAAETEELAANAGKKLVEKNLDLIVGNLIGEPGSGFAADTNQVTLFFRDGSRESLPGMGKEDVAHAIFDRILTLEACGP